MHEFMRCDKNTVLIFQLTATHFSNCQVYFQWVSHVLGFQHWRREREETLQGFTFVVANYFFTSKDSFKKWHLGSVLFMRAWVEYEWDVHKAAVDKRRSGTVHLGAVTIYKLPLISVCVCVANVPLCVACVVDI